MTGPTRRDVAVAGHQGDIDTAIAGLTTDDGSIRATALGALERLGELTDEQLITAFGDDDPRVRRRAAELAATHPLVDLVSLLADPDVNVVEMAAWTTGEHESNRPAVLDRLLELAQSAEEPLVREASVAALGAIGDPAAVDVIIAACSDKPAVRRRAVLALAPFEGANVEAAIEQALEDRDWQVRQAAEDLRRAQARPD
ncbi:MAG: HEAT repeat protein [Gammaproteobacteria bacterium]|jgi:HEAT repeat protein